MKNYLISFDENENPIVWLPTVLPKGQLESYLKFLDKKENKIFKEKESEKTNE